MIGRGEITKQAQSDRVDAQTAERDYILAHVAIEIAAGAGERMVLKGGTSLRLAHYDNYRYSADLDYSLLGITAYEAFNLIAEALGRCRDRIGIDILELDTNASPPRISYVGPLAAKPRSIKVDKPSRPCRRRTRYRTPINGAHCHMERSARGRDDPLLHADRDMRRVDVQVIHRGWGGLFE